MRKRLFALIALLALIAASIMAPHKAGATFNPNNVISDPVFQNTGTMDAGAIDALLNRYPNSCISTNSGFAAKEPTGYSPSGGFTFGNFVSAGRVIYVAAQVYGINPQVLIATMQKEQSTVIGSTNFCSNGDENKYAAAMGYGCPDGGTVYNWSGVSLYSRFGTEHTTTGSTCVNSAAKAGFSQQVIRAAWLLRFGQQRSLGNTGWAVVNGSWDNSDDPATCYGGPMTQGYRKRCSNDASAVYYDGYITIDGQSTHMDSGGTAAMYWYTPHFSGNQHFVDLFENTFGFGSTYDGRLFIAHPDGTLVRPANSPNVYLLKDGKAASVTSLGVFLSWGYSFDRVKIATPDDLNLLAAADADTSHTSNPAPLQYRDNTLLKGSGPTVYVMQGNQKRSLDTLDNFQRLGYDFREVLTIPDSELNALATGAPYDASQVSHPVGSMVKLPNDPTVYFLLSCNNGDPHCYNGRQAHSMTVLSIFLSHGYNFLNVKTATTADAQSIADPSWPVTWYREGTLVKGSAPTVYIIDADSSGINTNKRSFGTYYNFVGLDYHFNEVMSVPDNTLPVDGTGINQ